MSADSRTQLFFLEHVVENKKVWEQDPLMPHTAMNFAVSLNQLVDYFWEEFRSDPARVLGATTCSAFRSALRSSHPEFALIHDVADAHKHYKLTRQTRRVTEASQATLGALRWDDAVWDDARWDSPAEIVVTLDDGSKRSFATAAVATYEMWREKLLSAGLGAA